MASGACRYTDRQSGEPCPMAPTGAAGFGWHSSGSRNDRAPLRRFPACHLGERRGHETSRCARSEEHTSELQSLMRISYAVFCLKKKTIIIDTTKRIFTDTVITHHYHTHTTTSI